MPTEPSTKALEGRKLNVRNTRGNIRRTGSQATGPSEFDSVRDAEGGREFLEKNLLLVPAGEPITKNSLVTCLHQIANVSGIGKTVSVAVTAVAYLIEEMEDISVNEFVKEAVLTQLKDLTDDVKCFIDDAKASITEHVKSATAAPIPSARRSFTETLINPPPHADPKLAAREGIKARQFMLEGLDGESKVGQMNSLQLKTELNAILEKMGQEEKKI